MADGIATVGVMFRRGRRRDEGTGAHQHLQPVGVPVTLDHWCGDAEAQALRRALEAGDTRTVVDAYARADGHRREFLAQTITLGLPGLTTVHGWPTAEPGNALAFLLRGLQRVSVAWEVRGNGYAHTVSEDAALTFHEILQLAEEDLARSITLADDGVAWSALLVSGRGLSVGLDELRGRYGRAESVNPGQPNAADQLLQSLCRKWFGSDEEMLGFARAVSAASPAGDPRHRLIAVAHFERLLDAQDDPALLHRHRSNTRVHAEVLAAADRSVFAPGFGSSPQHVVTTNCFALVLSYLGLFDRARPLLERVGDAPTPWPWEYFDDMDVLREYRQAAGLTPSPGRPAVTSPGGSGGRGRWRAG